MNSTSHKIPSTYQKSKITEEFRDFIITRDHPCVMAQAVFLGEQAEMKVYPELGTEETAAALLRDLENYIEEYDDTSGIVQSFIAVFPQESYSETVFEKLLWKQLQLLHRLDIQPWDPEVHPDPENTNFSFSAGGKAFYVVGLHPNSSRRSRQAPYPALTFNLHQQFTRLREQGRYSKVQKRIRKRDKALQGDLNPMLEDFGEGSEARQYSGRKVGKDWKCPFLHKNKKDVPAEEVSEKG